MAHITVATVSRPKKGKRRLREVTLRPVSNGVMSRAHYEPDEGSMMLGGGSSPADETFHGSPSHMNKHVGGLFADSFPKRGGAAQGASAPDDDGDEGGQEAA